jgi:hypothetical protein
MIQAGRKLRFKVFEVIKIKANDVDIAYKSFPGRRVCTLQTCTFVWVKGKLKAEYRWLTRGYLVDDKGQEIKA